jgi:ATP-dependent protease ClpP protease subunit
MNNAKLPVPIALALSEDRSHATITIRGPIGDWWEGREIGQVENELGWVPATVKNLTLRITSMGGRLDHGLAIHNALQRHPAHKVAVIEGVAASAATIVAMAADEIHIHANASMMTHGVSFADKEGNAVEAPDAERVFNDTIFETYAAKTGKTREALAEYVAKDTWMTGREAVAAGFADKLIELASPRAQTETIAAFALAAGVPAEVIARVQSQASAPEIAPPAPEAAADQETPEADEAPETAPDAAPDATTQPATFAAQINALAVAAGLGDHVSAWLLDGQITTTAQAAAAIKEAREVRDLCAFADAADRAPEFIRSRTPLADVRAQLINARADHADLRSTDSTRRTTSPSAGNPHNGGNWDAALAQLKPIRSM